MPTYKTDWSGSDFINFGDWNRIESNILELASYLTASEFSVPTPSVVTNRTEKSIDYLSSINRIESNLGSIRDAFGMSPPTYLDKKTWTVGMGFSFDDANRLENNTQIIRTYADLVVLSYRRSGAFTCGDQGGLY